MTTTSSGFVPFTDERPDDAPWPAMKWPIDHGVVLSGGVVILSQFTEADAEALFAALDHDAVWAHVPGRPADADALAAAVNRRMAVRGDVAWVVRLREAVGDLPAGAVVGTTSYLDVVPEAARLEIGWTTYTPAVWGGPVNPSAKFVLLRHAFEELGAGRVQLKTDVRNHRSQRAIARLGARPEGVLRRYQPRADGTMRDTVMFSVIAEEWPAVSSGLQRRLDS
ncbi:N-acetyltransferase [Kineosporia sp. NBRC 101677]|uniref:GNAT family N-acetyltransferase n=1 Tax=Kineosporia sp. NBRC 101677 TaxID=3032197 RepID=UPI0024A4F6D1|nr:GNAT family protein [Kineosporia sp. NBRC 101677]GLY14663.1 N-acetyltransferase [Kineosporia sp. NBRC 101677]